MTKPVEAATIDGRVVDFWGASDFRDGLRDFWRVASDYPLEATRIPVRELAEQFAVENPDLLAACEVVPTIAYTFGRFDRRDNILQEGMGFVNPPRELVPNVFGLHNHWLGSARYAEELASIVNYLTGDQRGGKENQFKLRDQGFYGFIPVPPIVYRHHLAISHAGELGARQKTSPVHISPDRALQTLYQMQEIGVPDLLQTMQAGELLHHDIPTIPQRLQLTLYMIQQLADWHFGQEPSDLITRFLGLRKRYAKAEYLDTLLGIAVRFEAVVSEIIGEDLFLHLKNLPVPDWEREVRGRLASSVGKTPTELWPTYKEK